MQTQTEQRELADAANHLEAMALRVTEAVRAVQTAQEDEVALEKAHAALLTADAELAKAQRRFADAACAARDAYQQPQHARPWMPSCDECWAEAMQVDDADEVRACRLHAPEARVAYLYRKNPRQARAEDSELPEREDF